MNNPQHRRPQNTVLIRIDGQEKRSRGLVDENRQLILHRCNLQGSRLTVSCTNNSGNAMIAAKLKVNGQTINQERNYAWKFLRNGQTKQFTGDIYTHLLDDNRYIEKRRPILIFPSRLDRSSGNLGYVLVEVEFYSCVFQRTIEQTYRERMNRNDVNSPQSSREVVGTKKKGFYHVYGNTESETVNTRRTRVDWHHVGQMTETHVFQIQRD